MSNTLHFCNIIVNKFLYTNLKESCNKQIEFLKLLSDFNEQMMKPSHYKNLK